MVSNGDIKMRIRFYINLIAIALFIAGCSVTPRIELYRPWNRSFSSKEILPGTTVNLSVNGITNALISDEILYKNEIKNTLSKLLVRKGYTVADSNTFYNLSFNYKTERFDKTMQLTSAYSSTSKYYNSPNSSALTVLIANLIIGQNQTNTAVATLVSSTETYFTHTISIKLTDRSNNTIYIGESTWDTQRLDMLAELTSSLQILLSNFPSDLSIIPRANKIKKDSEINYYSVNCSNYWYSCPVLPYKIVFPTLYQPRLPSSVQNPEALEAYIDLIQTAENALPTGDDDYSNPLDTRLWRRSILGGKYFLGNDNTPVNLMIELDRRVDGYMISKCKLVSDSEYATFESKLFKWKEALKKYYDFYE